MKKRLLSILMAIIMLLLVGCGNKTSDSESSNDYSTYVGAWISDEASMDITYNNNDIINLSFFLPNHDGSRIASIDLSVLIASIVNNSVTMAFEDSWGTSGTAILTFKKDNIIFEIKNITPSGDMWGVYEGVFEFSRDDSQNEEEEYEEYYQPAPVYDTSKASGILAQAGLTEQAFKEMCTPLYDGWWSRNVTHKDYMNYNLFKIYGQQYYNENPNDEALQEVIKKWNNDTYLQETYGNVDAYIEYKEVYAHKGIEIIRTNSDSILNEMKEYPNNFIGKPYVLLDFNFDFDSYQNVYTDIMHFIPVAVTDLRDDIHNPNIINDNYYNFYVIFNGTYTSGNEIGLKFSLLSLEKTQ